MQSVLSKKAIQRSAQSSWHHHNFPAMQDIQVTLLIFGEWKRDNRARVWGEGLVESRTEREWEDRNTGGGGWRGVEWQYLHWQPILLSTKVNDPGPPLSSPSPDLDELALCCWPSSTTIHVHYICTTSNARGHFLRAKILHKCAICAHN